MSDVNIEPGRHGKGYLELRSSMPVLHVQGSPYERGFQHGYLLHGRIESTVSKGLSSASAVCAMAIGDTISEGFRRLRLGMEEAKKYIPQEFFEEIRGMSDALTVRGSRLDFDDMLTWNLMYDSWCFYAHPGFGDPAANYHSDTIGCSSFSAWGKATEDGAMVFGKNMDNLDLPGIPEGRLLVICDPSEGFGHVNITQAGMLAIDGGMNEKGISMMTHYSGSRYETMKGCGIGILSRMILQGASSVEDAIRILDSNPRCTGINYHVADATALKAVVVEANAKRIAVRKPYLRDCLWSTNHCNCYPGWMGYEGHNMVLDQQPAYRLKDISTIQAWQESLGEKDNPNIAAAGRFKRYKAMLDEGYGAIDLERGIEILRDRHHPDTGELRDWDSPAKARNDGMTISYLLPRKHYADSVPWYKSEGEGPVTGQSTNLWSMIAKPKTGEFLVALSGLPAHRYDFIAFNLLHELGR